MSEINTPITFIELLNRCSRVEIPLIQRDYAQGREAKKDVRDDFLKALHGALSLPDGSPELPLNLDFIYGSMEGRDKEHFLPLDGQQRLTTLFLLHWYLAWRDEVLPAFRQNVWDGKHARFTYGVRPSSTEFFDAIIGYDPQSSPESVSSVKRLLQDQSWFFLYWRLDPTIQSALNMLDAIHERFQTTAGLYARLVDPQRPVITFQLLPLEHFGLTDDLYIKMNARGKPLTAFETFKARFEELLHELFPTEKRKLEGTDLSVPSFFALRMDTQWTDFFWANRDKQTHLFDDALMNLLWALARVSLNPSNEKFADDTTSLRNKSMVATYTLFHDRGWLTRDFAVNLICLLETWSSGRGTLTAVLPDCRYFDESTFFHKAIQEPAALEYVQLVQFAAFIFYLRHHEGNVQSASLNEWMRVVFNLATNSDIERPEAYERCLSGLLKLLPHSGQILEHLSTADIGQIGFSPQQVREEILKAKLILANPEWRDRISEAELHGYFSGQIEFLLDFCGIAAQAKQIPVEEWHETEHAELQTAFEQYLKKAQITFDSSGLAPTHTNPDSHLWKRALLAVGDYLPSIGSNYSFLTDPPSHPDSWKRFLRDGESGNREYLKALWDFIDEDSEVVPQLEQIIVKASGLEPWRAAVVKHPELIDYCGQQEIRSLVDSEEIYLLRKRQMNGNHAELFSYALHLELWPLCENGRFAPLKRLPYCETSGTEIEPYVKLSYEGLSYTAIFAIESTLGAFRIYLMHPSPEAVAALSTMLTNGGGFTEENGALSMISTREAILETLDKLASSLLELGGISN